MILVGDIEDRGRLNVGAVEVHRNPGHLGVGEKVQPGANEDEDDNVSPEDRGLGTGIVVLWLGDAITEPGDQG